MSVVSTVVIVMLACDFCFVAKLESCASVYIIVYKYLSVSKDIEGDLSKHSAFSS